MTIQKRNKKRKYNRREEVKSFPAPPIDKAILEPVNKKYPRICEYDYCKTDSVYCPRCGKVTNILE